MALQINVHIITLSGSERGVRLYFMDYMTPEIILVSQDGATVRHKATKGLTMDSWSFVAIVYDYKSGLC